MVNKNSDPSKEAIEIRKKGGTTMNRDDGQYSFSHVLDEILIKIKKRLIDRSTGNTEYMVYNIHNREVADTRTAGISIPDTACFHSYSMNRDS